MTTPANTPKPEIRPAMTRNIGGDRCPHCGSEEIDAMTPVTVYACGSSDYDRRPNTFKKGNKCKLK